MGEMMISRMLFVWKKRTKREIQTNLKKLEQKPNKYKKRNCFGDTIAYTLTHAGHDVL